MNRLIRAFTIAALTLRPGVRGETDTIGMIVYAAPQAVTLTCNEESPTSALQFEHAVKAAFAAARATGEDVVVSRVAATGSMQPYFDENALLLLAATPFDRLQVGDIVTFYHPRLKQIVAHRLIERRHDRFWSKGDHNRGMDDVYITRENYRRLLVGIIYMRPGNGCGRGAPQ